MEAVVAAGGQVVVDERSPGEALGVAAARQQLRDIAVAVGALDGDGGDVRAGR